MALGAAFLVLQHFKIYIFGQDGDGGTGNRISVRTADVVAAADPPHSGRPSVSASKKARSTGNYSIRNIAVEYPLLAKLAEDGDQTASRTLFHDLTRCRVAPRTRDDLDRGIADLRQRATEDLGLKEGADTSAAYLQANFELCNGVSDQQLASRAKWNALLAASGDSDARLRFAFINIPDEPQRADYSEEVAVYASTAHQYLNDEIEAGNADALLSTSLAYSRPNVVGQHSAFPEDDELAYQYLFAFSLSPGNQEPQLAQLAKLESKLSGEQIQQAQQAGSELYKQCCS